MNAKIARLDAVAAGWNGYLMRMERSNCVAFAKEIIYVEPILLDPPVPQYPVSERILLLFLLIQEKYFVLNQELHSVSTILAQIKLHFALHVSTIRRHLFFRPILYRHIRNCFFSMMVRV